MILRNFAICMVSKVVVLTQPNTTSLTLQASLNWGYKYARSTR